MRDPANSRPGGRKAYAAPAVDQSGAFERLVLACTHLPTSRGNCHPAMVNS
jgi:hypothetical protein